MKVAIFMGSKSDVSSLKAAVDCLEEFGIACKAHILSAHRVPEQLLATLEEVESNDTQCIIAAAGLAAHLPGVIAAHTILPVIGVPICGAWSNSSSGLGGLDSLYSIVQMPKPIPVATVGINNSYNAAMLAVQILALKYPEIKKKLQAFRCQMKRDYLLQNQGDPFAQQA